MAKAEMINKLKEEIELKKASGDVGSGKGLSFMIEEDLCALGF